MQAARIESAMVTGAFGYVGRYVTSRLLEAGVRVRTLTGHPGREDPFGGRVEAVPFHFEAPERLAADLAGVEVLFNTYWVRFDRGERTFARAVRDSERLVTACRRAGVRRIVHVSITNPSLDSPLPYFRGKAEVEAMIRDSGVSHAIVRPTVLFGREDILVNNIAWALRRLPLFGVPGRGRYRLQPVFVADAARLMVELAAASDDVTVDAVGPETFAFIDLVRLVGRHVAPRTPVLPFPPRLALLAARLLGLVVGDVMLTRDEVAGLSADLLVSAAPATCSTSFSAWIAEHGRELGRRYASEVARHYR